MDCEERIWSVQQKLQKRRLVKVRLNFCTFFKLYVFKEHLVNRVHAWVIKTDAHGTVKNLNIKSNSRAARSGLKKVRDEATIEKVRLDLTGHQKGALGKDHRSLV